MSNIFGDRGSTLFTRRVGILLIVLFFTLNITIAHPGGKASDGCHYCRTNCAKWGEVANARHCHGVSTPAYVAPTRTTPSCPLHAYYNSSSQSCECSTGYTKHYNDNRCVSIPSNAYATPYSSTDSWLCNDGYKEVGNSCIEIIEETIDKLQGINVGYPQNRSSLSNSSTNSESGSGIFTTLFWLLAGGWGYKAYRDKKDKQKV